MIKNTGYRVLDRTTETERISIYRALSEESSRPVCIYELRLNALKPGALNRIEDEYRIINGLDYEWLIKPVDLKRTDTSLLLVMADTEGRTLNACRKDRRCQLDKFLTISIQLAGYLGALHSHGLLHRNINPENIIINNDKITLLANCASLFSDFTRDFSRLYSNELVLNTLPYISPENTDLTTNPVDVYSDLYSLGAVFYEMLAGIVPFQSDDPLDILNSHVSMKPFSVADLNHDIPAPVSDIIMKLLEKSPDERYISSFGLAHDLEECAASLKKKGSIRPFTLGERDIPERFRVSKKLYGRDNDISMLSSALEKARKGKCEILNVTGPSGIGKTTLVMNIMRPLIGTRGYFISGKCEQLKKDIPYSPIVQAFQGLVKQILSESEDGIQIWKESILEAVERNGQIIIDLIPEVEMITGPQPPVPELGPEESQNRLNMLFTRFLRVFLTSNRPLNLFIDDLQWVDSATLTLVKFLVTDPEIRSFLLMGAYRDNEISEFHNIYIMHQELENAGIIVNEINLAPLSIDEISMLIHDTFRCAEKETRSLAELALTHTMGNPLFVNHFLKSIYDEKLLTFRGENGWVWDYERIRQLYETENVIKLMVNRISQYPDEAQNILTVASCMGNTFSIGALSPITGIPEHEIMPIISSFVSDGYLMPSDSEFRFSHDKIHEAAYSLIPDGEKATTHLQIGRTMLMNMPERDIYESIFDIANHLNIGSNLVNDHAEKYTIARLNLRAGIKAKLTVAYEAAVIHFNQGIRTLPENAWSEEYSLAMDLHRESFECEYLLENLEAAYNMFVKITRNSRTALEKARLYDLNAALLMNQSKPGMAIDMGLIGLNLLGVKMPRNPSRIHVFLEFVQLRKNLGSREVDSLLDLPVMTDPVKTATMSLMLNLWMPAYATDHNLMRLLSLKMVNTSLKYGNCDISSFGYITLGMIFGSGEGDFTTGYSFGELALKLNNRFKKEKLDCTLDFMFAAFHNHWENHVNTSIEYFSNAYECGHKTGDVYYSRLNCVFHTSTMVMKGDRIDDVITTANEYLDYLSKGKNDHAWDVLTSVIKIMQQLKGTIRSTLSLSDDEFDEDHFVKQLSGKEVVQPLHWYSVFKSRNLYLFEHYKEAMDLIHVANTVINWHFSSFVLPEHYFLHSLIMIQLCENASPGARKKYIKIIRRNQATMKGWSELCPENFLHKYLLIGAELKRIQGKGQEAMILYTRAINSARENGFVQNEGIACELAALFYMSTGMHDIALTCITASISCFSRWGAAAKVEFMKKKYADILAGTGDTGVAFTEQDIPGEKAHSLEGDVRMRLGSLARKLQSLSGSTDTAPVISRLADIIFEYIDPDRIVLLLRVKESLFVHAAGERDNIEIFSNPVPLNEYNSVPPLIIGTVEDGGTTVVANDIPGGTLFLNDPYLMKNRPGSVMAVPVISSGAVMGILYLENSRKQDFSVQDSESAGLIAAYTALLTGKTSPKKGKKAGQTLLSQLDMDDVIHRLNQLMDIEKVYLTEDLTLQMLAVELSINTHQLSELLNNYLHVNFKTYINRYRIEEAMRILRDEPERPVLNIIYDVGFNSVSVFYSAFTKFTGMSPAKYRKELFEEKKAN